MRPKAKSSWTSVHIIIVWILVQKNLLCERAGLGKWLIDWVKFMVPPGQYMKRPCSGMGLDIGRNIMDK